jgi:hypothetical protein
MFAAADHLVKWISTGTPPPTAPKFDYQLQAGPTGFAIPIFGGDGIVSGGIRLPQVEAPIAHDSGYGCSTFGRTVPFTKEELQQRCRDHSAYVNAVRKSAQDHLRNGYILRVDADAIVEEAASSNVGM